MAPNFRNSDLVVINKISYITAQPERGDSVILRFPGDPDHQRYIKRIIGRPREKLTIRDGQVHIEGRPLFEPYLAKGVTTFPATEVLLKEDQYYLIGDNRDNSSDSRIWGVASRGDFVGKAFFIIYPRGRVQPISQPVY